MTLLCAYEVYRLTTKLDRKNPLLYMGLMFTITALCLSSNTAIHIIPFLITALMVISLCFLLADYTISKKFVFQNWVWIISGGLYVGLLMGYWIALRYLGYGMIWVFLAMFMTFANDTGSYFIGRKFGRRKLAAAISPNKTWEGTVGGIISTLILSVISYFILGILDVLVISAWQIILLACLISLFAQLGDLVESLLKRHFEAKESGRFLPGHGGILDRFDSLMFVGPAAYYFILWVVL
jgi:phosphatidate cytidylyltransferase